MRFLLAFAIAVLALPRVARAVLPDRTNPAPASTVAVWLHSPPGVLRTERMPSRAACLGGVVGTDRIASQEVDALRHRFEVRRIHAVVDPAQVVELQPVGYRAVDALPTPLVRHGDAILTPNASGVFRADDGIREQSIAVAITPPGPNPTARGCVAAHVALESSLRLHVRWHSRTPYRAIVRSARSGESL